MRENKAVTEKKGKENLTLNIMTLACFFVRRLSSNNSNVRMREAS